MPLPCYRRARRRMSIKVDMRAGAGLLLHVNLSQTVSCVLKFCEVIFLFRTTIPPSSVIKFEMEEVFEINRSNHSIFPLKFFITLSHLELFEIPKFGLNNLNESKISVTLSLSSTMSTTKPWRSSTVLYIDSSPQHPLSQSSTMSTIQPSSSSTVLYTDCGPQHPLSQSSTMSTIQPWSSSTVL